MRTPFARVTGGALALLATLAGLQLAAQAGYALPGLAGDAVSTMANRDLNQEGREALTAGYYEGLINEGARLGGMNRLVTDARKFTVEDRSQPDRRQVNAFHFYELIPSSDVPDYADGRARYRLKTNSHGLADKEYQVKKPAGVRRIALFGDSVTRGQGAPFQGNFEALLEVALNSHQDQTSRGRVEILNFGVGSYSVLQMMDTAIERATPYGPDVYVVAMTQLSVARGWGHHLGLLMAAGLDPKYQHLRELIRVSGVTSDDSRGVLEAKLARFRLPTLRWSLGHILLHAAKSQARVVVLLVPTAQDPSSLEEHFLGVRPILKDLGLPVVDLLGTYRGADLAAIRVADNDRHPNAEGHRLLYEALYRRIRDDPQLQELLLGRRGYQDQ